MDNIAWPGLRRVENNSVKTAFVSSIRAVQGNCFECDATELSLLCSTIRSRRWLAGWVIQF
jgi:hypothetical protein